MPIPAGIAGVLVPGTMVSEAVFFHPASRAVILTDLIENFEPARIRSRLLRWLVRLSVAAHPPGQAPIDLRLTFRPTRRRVLAAVAAILDWEFYGAVMGPGLSHPSDASAGGKECGRAC